jgi:hypothetical protein
MNQDHIATPEEEEAFNAVEQQSELRFRDAGVKKNQIAFVNTKLPDPIMTVSDKGFWVNPDIPVDETAKAVIAILDQHYKVAKQEPVVCRELLREARDNCKASIVEDGISASRKEYRIDLEARLTAALNASHPPVKESLTTQQKPVAARWLAEMIMSDCGHSSNNQRLLDRILNRIFQFERANIAYEFETGLQEGMKRERALWLMQAEGQKIEQPRPLTDDLPNGFVPLQSENGKVVYAACLDVKARHYKWLMWLHPDGHWVSKRKLEEWEVMQAEDQEHYGIVIEAAHGIKDQS